MKIEDIEDQLNRDDFSSQQVYELVTSLIRDKKAQKKKYERITDDDIERINVAGLLLSKSEVATTNQNNVVLNKNEYDRFGDVYSKVKAMIKELELEAIIDFVSAAIGGIYFYHIAQRDQYKDYLYNQIRFVIRKVQEPKIPTNAFVKDIPTREVIRDLDSFRLFVEKDGFLAFWENSSVGKSLKNYPEEIAHAELLAFFAGEDIFIKGAQYREVPTGAGYSDIIRIESGGVKLLFEIKVIKENENRFTEGLHQLFYYMCKDDVTIGYYIIFETRSRNHRTDKFKSEYNKDNKKKILVTVIDIYPVAHTKKF
jgi:hypothetical protein